MRLQYDSLILFVQLKSSQNIREKKINAANSLTII